MSNVVVIGSQWGDEGKGKIVDWLSSRADVVVRFQGGHNAGHTLVIGDQVYKLHLLPSGIVRDGTLSMIGNGVVIDPWALIQEMDTLDKQEVSVTPDRLKIAESAALILPIHTALDKTIEKARGAKKIGTTGRGIGPAYEDKVARRAIRVCDLADEAALKTKIDSLLLYHNALQRGFGQPEYKTEDLLEKLIAIAPKILPFAGNCSRELEILRRQGKRILFEGAQGVMLDVDHGTYPYVTSSNTIAAEAATGSGFGVTHLKEVLGITKAYTTRVGSGPFPTELQDDIGEHIGQRGKEFGTTTGRKRRCGWFDAVQVRQAIRIGGITGVALTKLDVLDELDEIKICTGYRCDNETYDDLPAAADLQERIEPVYETLDGWQSTTQGARRWVDLPDAAIKYVRRIEELIECPVTLLSTSPEREDTILVKDPFVA